MGCDIHWYSESKKNGDWICDQKDSFIDNKTEGIDLDYFPNSHRDYWFFGLLSEGVRCDFDAAFPAKGFPEDASIEVAALYRQWDCDAHSSSWLTRQELKDKLQEFAVIRTELLIKPIADESEMAAHHVKRLQETISNLTAEVPDTDHRIVFWFNN